MFAYKQTLFAKQCMVSDVTNAGETGMDLSPGLAKKVLHD